MQKFTFRSKKKKSYATFRKVIKEREYRVREREGNRKILEHLKN